MRLLLYEVMAAFFCKYFYFLSSKNQIRVEYRLGKAI